MSIDICKVQENKLNKSKASGSSQIDSSRDPVRDEIRHTNDDSYATYSYADQGVVFIKPNERKVAISKLEWLALREASKNTEWQWLMSTVSFCVSLLFSSICLLGTTTFQHNGEILWLPLLTTVGHVAGCLLFIFLSIYLWQKKRTIKQDPICKDLKRQLDDRFELHNDCMS